MKKKILAFACAMTLIFGMGMSVSAASSSTSSATAGEVAELVSAKDNATGQVLTTETIKSFAETTSVSGVAGASLTAVSTETAKAMISQARTIAGSNTFIASIVDLNVPAGTGTATFTLGCPNVWKGQNVTILHLKSNGTYETITPSSVEDNKVTFTMTSYSPVAIVINTGSTGAKSPKTGEIITLAAAMAAVSGIGAAVCGRKAKRS